MRSGMMPFGHWILVVASYLGTVDGRAPLPERYRHPHHLNALAIVIDSLHPVHLSSSYMTT